MSRIIVHEALASNRVYDTEIEKDADNERDTILIPCDMVSEFKVWLG